MNELALFAGAGGGLLASRWLLGHRIVCYVENDPYCVKVIKARIGNSLLYDAPIWDDARTFDGKPWSGKVDLISAGFPCQPFSVAGKRRGEDDERNMWPDTIRVIREVGPPLVFLENVPGLLAGHGYFGRILGDLAEAGFDAEWCVLSAADVGANHLRARLWILAYATGCGQLKGERGPKTQEGSPEERPRETRLLQEGSDGRRNVANPSELLIRQKPHAGADGTRHPREGALPREGPLLADPPIDDGRLHLRRRGQEQASPLARGDGEEMADTYSAGRKGDGTSGSKPAHTVSQRSGESLADAAQQQDGGIGQSRETAARVSWWQAEPDVGRVVDGVPSRVDRLRALGNGQVPRVAARAFRLLMERASLKAFREQEVPDDG